MNILDRITDLIVTAWELIGLILLSGSADPVLLRRWESELEEKDADSQGGTYPAGPGPGGQHARFA